LGFPADHQGSLRRRGPRHASCGQARRLPPRAWKKRASTAGAFGNDSVFLERYIRERSHVEVRILGDSTESAASSRAAELLLQRASKGWVEVGPSGRLRESVRLDFLGLRALTSRRGYLAPAPWSFGDADLGELVLHRIQPAHPGRAHGHLVWSPASTLYESRCKIAQGHSRPYASRCRCPAGRALRQWLRTAVPRDHRGFPPIIPFPDYGKILPIAHRQARYPLDGRIGLRRPPRSLPYYYSLSG